VRRFIHAFPSRRVLRLDAGFVFWPYRWLNLEGPKSETQDKMKTIRCACVLIALSRPSLMLDYARLVFCA